MIYKKSKKLTITFIKLFNKKIFKLINKLLNGFRTT